MAQTYTRFNDGFTYRAVVIIKAAHEKPENWAIDTPFVCDDRNLHWRMFEWRRTRTN